MAKKVKPEHGINFHHKLTQMYKNHCGFSGSAPPSEHQIMLTNDIIAKILGGINRQICGEYDQYNSLRRLVLDSIDSNTDLSSTSEIANRAISFIQKCRQECKYCLGDSDKSCPVRDPNFPVEDIEAREEARYKVGEKYDPQDRIFPFQSTEKLLDSIKSMGFRVVEIREGHIELLGDDEGVDIIIDGPSEDSVYRLSAKNDNPHTVKHSIIGGKLKKQLESSGFVVKQYGERGYEHAHGISVIYSVVPKLFK